MMRDRHEQREVKQREPERKYEERKIKEADRKQVIINENSVILNLYLLVSVNIARYVCI